MTTHNPITAECSIGLLVVHGIGDQSTGAAVRQAAEPILEVLQRFAELTGSPAPEIQDADLRPIEGPARVTIGPVYADGPDGAESSWLICEAHWADSFTAPSLSRMFLWSFDYSLRVIKRLFVGKLKAANLSTDQLHLCVTRVLVENLGRNNEIPESFADIEYWTKKVSQFLILEEIYDADDVHASEDVIREEVRQRINYYSTSKTNPRVDDSVLAHKVLLAPLSAKTARAFIAIDIASRTLIASLILFMLGIVLLPLMLLVLVLIAVLSVIPGVNSPFRSIRSALERSVGDAFVFTKDPVGRAAILSSVRRAVEWIEANCDTYVVVAHSQGTVVVENLFNRGVLDRAKSIVVYGSAIGLLEEPSKRWIESDKWVSFRTPNDLVAPGPLRSRGGLADDPFKWDRRVRGWNRISVDHTSYWSERETFVVDVVKNAAASVGTSMLVEWAASLADNAQNYEWPFKINETPKRGFTRDYATWVGRAVGLLVFFLVSTEKGAALADWVGFKALAFLTWSWNKLLLPIGIPNLFDMFEELPANLPWLVGLLLLMFVAANLARKLSWKIAARSCRARWLRQSEEALQRSHMNSVRD